jgi:protein involved in ribonucleotide reduction
MFISALETLKIKNLLGGKKKMARTKQYVVYTREFAKGRVSNKVGVFIDEAKNTLDNTGTINGGVIKFKNLKMTRKTPTTDLVAKGYNFNVRVIGSGNYDVAKQIKNSVIELLADTGKTVINANA